MEMHNVHDAKTHFSKLLDRVERGEQIVIARNGRPVAQLAAYQPRRRRRVRPSAWKDLVPDISLEEFDAANEEIARDFGMLD
jgi:prevent-host-death family protein